jgi:hypothetical protein
MRSAAKIETAIVRENVGACCMDIPRICDVGFVSVARASLLYDRLRWSPFAPRKCVLLTYFRGAKADHKKPLGA